MNDQSTHDRLKNLDEQAQKLVIERSLLVQKALQSTDVDEIYKAQQYLQKIKSPTSGLSKPDSHKSLIFDPFEVSSSQGYYNKTTQLSYEILRGMSKAPIINAVISTRKDQIAEFCIPQQDKYSKGFVLKKKGTDAKYTPTDREKREIDQHTEFLINCAEDEEVWDLWDLDAFVRMLIEDSLVLDQGCFEVVRNRGGNVSQFLAIDGATIRIADSYDNENNIRSGDVKINGHYPSYVQIYQNTIVNEYYPWELCFGIRNPSTSIHSNGYGKSELEILIATITSMLNTDAYNSNFFKNGTAPKGALFIKNAAGVNRDAIAEMRREWGAMMSGVGNMHKTPILNADQAQWVDLFKTNREMEFSKFQEYLIKVVCACYKISPEEIGFPLQGSSGGGLGRTDGGQEEKNYSKEKGLKPLLKALKTWLNKYIVGPRTQNRYELDFRGIDIEDSKSEEERLIKAGGLYMEINEVRAARGMDPLPYGDMIANQIVAQKIQMEQQQQQEVNPYTQPLESDQPDGPFEKALQNFWTEQMKVA